jgi:hypothetical protein
LTFLDRRVNIEGTFACSAAANIEREYCAPSAVIPHEISASQALSAQ